MGNKIDINMVLQKTCSSAILRNLTSLLNMRTDNPWPWLQEEMGAWQF